MPRFLTISLATTIGVSIALAGSNDQYPIDLPHRVLRSLSNLTRHLHFHVPEVVYNLGAAVGQTLIQTDCQICPILRIFSSLGYHSISPSVVQNVGADFPELDIIFIDLDSEQGVNRRANVVILDANLNVTMVLTANVRLGEQEVQ